MLLITQKIKEKQILLLCESLWGHWKGGVQGGQDLVTSPETGRSWGGVGVRVQLCGTLPWSLTIALLLPQTKDVTKAMNEKRFDEAMKLRGR